MGWECSGYVYLMAVEDIEIVGRLLAGRLCIHVLLINNIETGDNTNKH